MAEIGKNLYIAYTDDIKYVIYEFFSPDTNITRTLIILDFVNFKFRVYKKKCPISAVKKKFTKYFRYCTNSTGDIISRIRTT